ncbi:DUF3667 domain-containing protein [Kriegella sp. EG-1]|nr:DUF3667 domain-containing protein [Flavobacteriaceae bacterium EG-1]
MNCKNCKNSLETNFSFCPNCGAKVIHNRLTLKNLGTDFFARYFNLENTLIKTILHLFYQPQLVIEGYINGTRKKYLNPVSYLGLGITLSGLIVILIKKYSSKIDLNIINSGGKSAAMTTMFDFTMDYQAIITIMLIPLMAIASWLSFQNKNYNFTERQIVFMYTITQYTLVSIIPSVVILLFAPELYGTSTLYFLAFLYLYSAFVIKKISNLNGVNYWARLFLFFVIFTILYLCLSTLILILLVVFSDISIQDFAPQN